jgi:hypothetical protein
MKYYLATYNLVDGEHEHSGTVIIEAKTLQEAREIATDQEHSPATTYTEEEQANGTFKYFDFGGDGTTAAKNQEVIPISDREMRFLERVGLGFRLSR